MKYLLCALITLGGLFQTRVESDLLKAADEVLQQVARLRGLAPKGDIKKGIVSRDDIARFLNERVREEYEEIDLIREGIVLKKLGLIPADMDYEKFMLKLLTEQIGGYYDPEKKTFFIADWIPLDQQKQVMAHELLHALQDQHFDLESLMKQDRKVHNDDLVMAHHALFEGDGVAVMLDYVLEPAGRNFTQLPNLVETMRGQLPAMEAEFPVFNQSPPFLKEMLLFPYSQGAGFLQAVRARESWAGVNRIYSDLPASSEQILHPDKYLRQRDRPQLVAINDPARLLGPGWASHYRNVLGEFTIYLILKLHLSEDEAAKGSAGWGGDQLLLAEKGEASGVFSESVWDTTADAEEFYAAIGKWLQRRLPRGTKNDGAANAVTWLDAGGYYSVQREGTRVRWIVGLPESSSAKMKDYR